MALVDKAELHLFELAQADGQLPPSATVTVNATVPTTSSSPPLTANAAPSPKSNRVVHLLIPVTPPPSWLLLSIQLLPLLPQLTKAAAPLPTTVVMCLFLPLQLRWQLM
jgi:hypothetical protein